MIYKPGHIPQNFTQRLIDHGVIVFSETISVCGYINEYYEIENDFIMTYENQNKSAVFIFVEIYNEEGEFEMFKVNRCADDDDVDITPNDIEVYKRIRL